MRQLIVLIIYIGLGSGLGLAQTAVPAPQKTNPKDENINLKAQSYSEHLNDLRNRFQANQVSPEETERFTVRGIQKVEDFADYIGIIGNSSYDDALRKQAASMLENLFVDDEREIEFPFRLGKSRRGKGEDTYSVSSFVNALLKVERGKVKVSIRNIEVDKPLKWKQNPETLMGAYEGVLYCELVTEVDMAGSRSTVRVVKQRINLRLEKRTKRFGDMEQKVWEVLLGDME